MLDVLLLDSRDSFTWNLAHAFQELGARVEVVSAHGATLADVEARSPRLVCIGPGPRGPSDMPALTRLAGEVCERFSVLGVCLGLQAMVLAHGGDVGRAVAPVHGRRSAITHDGSSLFAGLPSPLWVMRYHSLVATRVPEAFRVVARDEVGQPMAVARPGERLCAALQFHPESIGTAGGLELLRAALIGAGARAAPVEHRAGAIPPPEQQGPSTALVRPPEPRRAT